MAASVLTRAVSTEDRAPWPCTAIAFDASGGHVAWARNKEVVLAGVNAQIDDHDGSDTDLADDNRLLTTERILNCNNPVMSLSFGGAYRTQRPNRDVQAPGCSKDGHTRESSPRKRARKLHSFEEPVLAVGLRNGQVQFWSVSTGELITVRCGHASRVSDLQFCPLNRMLLASTGHDGKVAVWDLDDEAFQCQELKPCACQDVRCSVQVFSVSWCPPRGFHLAVATSESLVHIWRTDDWSMVHSLTDHQHVVCAADYSPDGCLLATASWDTSVIVWCSASYVVLRKLWHMLPPPRPVFAFGYNGHALRCVTFTADSAHLVTANEDRCLRVFSLYDPGPNPQLVTECVPDRQGQTATEASCLVAQPRRRHFIAAGFTSGQCCLLNLDAVTAQLPLNSLAFRVSSLRDRCRAEIRRCIQASVTYSLGSYAPAKTSQASNHLKTLVSQLPISRRLQQFIMYRDLSVVQAKAQRLIDEQYPVPNST